MTELEQAIEKAAAAVHDAYLRFSSEHGWPVKPELSVPFNALSQVAQDIDRATVEAVISAMQREGYQFVKFVCVKPAPFVFDDPEGPTE